MNITRWEPITSFVSRVGDVDWIFDDFLSDWSVPRLWGRRGYETAEFFPQVDVKDHENEYVLVADVPGVPRDKLDVNVLADRVTLKGCYGEEESASEGDGRSYYCQERYAGCFERGIALPGEIDVDGVKATLLDGVLTMHLPKAHAERMRRIELTEQ